MITRQGVSAYFLSCQVISPPLMVQCTRPVNSVPRNGVFRDLEPMSASVKVQRSSGAVSYTHLEAILSFNKGIIDAICDVVPAVKPQCAFYERFGWQGMKALAETIAYAKEKGMFVIIDGKRNDIGSTMTAYAVAHLGDVEVEGEVYTPFGGDALTVNGYLGTDGISPLTDICVKKDAGIFVLVKTSNRCV